MQPIKEGGNNKLKRKKSRREKRGNARNSRNSQRHTRKTRENNILMFVCFRLFPLFIKFNGKHHFSHLTKDLVKDNNSDKSVSQFVTKENNKTAVKPVKVCLQSINYFLWFCLLSLIIDFVDTGIKHFIFQQHVKLQGEYYFNNSSKSLLDNWPDVGFDGDKLDDIG